MFPAKVAAEAGHAALVRRMIHTSVSGTLAGASSHPDRGRVGKGREGFTLGAGSQASAVVTETMRSKKIPASDPAAMTTAGVAAS